jgi:glycosyltransferase involved in cell wall biosynthesis
VDAIRQIIQNETCGFLVDYGDTADLSRKIVRLLGDGAMRDRFRRNALQRVRSLYDWDVVMKSLGPVLLGV